MELAGMENKWIIVALLLVVGVGFLFVGVSFLRLRSKLREGGKRATATVTGVTTKTVRRGSKRNSRYVTQYVCSLEFQAGSKTQTVKYTTESVCSVGEKIEITYLPENPKKFMSTDQLADSTANKILPLIPVVIGVIVLITGVIAALQ